MVDFFEGLWLAGTNFRRLRQSKQFFTTRFCRSLRSAKNAMPNVLHSDSVAATCSDIMVDATLLSLEPSCILHLPVRSTTKPANRSSEALAFVRSWSARKWRGFFFFSSRCNKTKGQPKQETDRFPAHYYYYVPGTR